MLQLTRSELMDITEDWVHSVFTIEEKDRAYIERLVMLQIATPRTCVVPATS